LTFRFSVNQQVFKIPKQIFFGRFSVFQKKAFLPLPQDGFFKDEKI